MREPLDEPREIKPCLRCKGSGETIDDIFELEDSVITRIQTCGKCGGKGFIDAGLPRN